MASVTGRTAASIDQLMDEMVVEIFVDDNGQIIYKRRSGEEINGGSLTNAALAVDKAWPVNSIFIATVPTSPATLLDVGTWVRFGEGRMLVSQDGTQTEFDASEETGGAKSTTLTGAHLPAHTHTLTAHTHTMPNHDHGISASYDTEQVDGAGSESVMNNWFWGTGSVVDKTGSTQMGGAGNTGSAGGGNTGSTGSATATPVPTLPPYVVVYMWKRTA